MHIHVSWLDPKKVREIVVVGNKKMAVFDDLNINAPLTIYDKHVTMKKFSRHYDSFREFQMIIKNGKVKVPFIKPQEPLQRECRHFVECIRENTVPLTDGKDGLAVLKIMAALTRSLNKQGRRVKLNR